MGYPRGCGPGPRGKCERHHPFQCYAHDIRRKALFEAGRLYCQFHIEWCNGGPFSALQLVHLHLAGSECDLVPCSEHTIGEGHKHRYWHSFSRASSQIPCGNLFLVCQCTAVERCRPCFIHCRLTEPADCPEHGVVSK